MSINPEDPRQCADLLNNFVQSQFQAGLLAGDSPTMNTDSEIPKIGVEEVAKLIKELPNGKSPGPDRIRKPGMPIDLHSAATSLAHIYRASLVSGRLPTQWKTTHVTPIHKRGDAQSPNNYRPISLTSLPCKMMEHIVLHYLNVRQHSTSKTTWL